MSPTKTKSKAGVSVEQLAELINVPVEKLKQQIKKAFDEAGIEMSDSDIITEQQKKILLDSLKRDHGEQSEEPKKITLKRKSVSEIKVQRSSGKKGTVSVVRKKRHVYVKRDAAALLEEEAKQQAQAEQAAVAETPAVETAAPEISELKDTFVPEESLKAPAPLQEVPATQAPAVAASAAAAAPAAAAKPKAEPEKHGRGKGRFAEDEGEGKAKGKGRGKGRGDTRDWQKTKMPKLADISLTTITEEEEEVTTAPPGGAFGHRRGRPKPRAKDFTTQMQVSRKELQKKHAFERPEGPIVREIAIPETITVAELAQKMSIKSAEIIKNLMKLGTMATINQPLDQATASVVVEELGHKVKLLKDTTVEDELLVKGEEALLPRGPVVTVMGHVDHGKTSLLDYIRRTKVVAKEAGGITQHIGAYLVPTSRGNITFLDTPGHAAFTAMRARGVKATDIVVLVVAADDGVMPQTIEAIQHAKAGNVPIVVAVNKMDKAGADISRVQNDLSQHGLLTESWGGDVMMLPVSAKEGTGIDALLEAIAIQAEMLELKAPTTGLAKGVVIEARLDKGRGPVATVLVQSGTLHSSDVVLAGLEFGRIRAMVNERGEQITEAGPSVPVEILGLAGIPAAGDPFAVVQDERKAREIAMFRQAKQRDLRMAKQTSSLEGLFDKLQHSDSKTLKIILKADVSGSAEAIAEALEALSTDQIKVKIVSQGVGGINESDITLAMASDALVIGFNVRADATARRLAEKESIEIEYFSIIYDIVDGVKRAINGMLGPEYKEKILGTAEVRDVFRSAKIGAIAGCMVIEGIVKRSCPIRVLRNNVVIYQGELESLRRFKDDVSEVRSGTECGIGVKNYNDIKVGDQIEVYETVQVTRT